MNLQTTRAPSILLLPWRSVLSCHPYISHTRSHRILPARCFRMTSLCVFLHRLYRCHVSNAHSRQRELQEWHCTLRGPAGTDFEGGLYHFRIRLPAEYPFRPPSIMLLTPNGRFELNTKASGAYHLILLAVHRALILKISIADLHQLHQLCVTFFFSLLVPSIVIRHSFRPAADHEELWQPAWGVRTGVCHFRSIHGSSSGSNRFIL